LTTIKITLTQKIVKADVNEEEIEQNA